MATRVVSPLEPSPSTGEVVAIRPYPIGAAARLAGISSETLRIWERRYQLLAPGRTGGGHRLYGEDDVALLRAVKRLVDSGMRIGAVAALSRAQIFAEAERIGPPPTPVTERAPSLIDDVIEAARGLDERRVAQLLDRPLMLASGEEVVQSVYLPLLQRVGDLWHAGQLSIGVEHFLTGMVSARVMAVFQMTPQPQSGHLALCACPPGERHEVGLFAAALTLKAGGVPVTVLGGDLPVAELKHAIENAAPALVLLAVTNQPSKETVGALSAVLSSEAARDVAVIIGGAAAQTVAAGLGRPATVVHRMSELVGVARRLIAQSG